MAGSSLDFLFELRCEEIPARMQAGARADLERLFLAELDKAGLKAQRLTIWSTPRRLALIAHGLPQGTQAVSEEAKGPPEGAPDAAIDGFCRKNGVARDQLELRDVKGRNTWFAVIEKPGRATSEVLAEAIPAIVRAFPWPKSQRWGAASLSTESLRWVRPLSGIIALLGGEVVPFEIDGIASGNVTRGHRFHSQGDITIGGAADYAERLRSAHVIVDHAEREDIVRDGAAQAAANAGLVLVADEGLVIENAGLTEWPVPLLGRFDESYLDVPPEVIQLTARVNQKYFVCEDGEGKLAPAFVCTANIDAKDGGTAIVEGNRKVLAARLSDARFFWELDQKTSLADHAKKLERITFHEKLGTVADKVDRVAKLAGWLVEEGIIRETPLPLAGGAGGGPETLDSPTPNPSRRREGELADLAEQAARLCKADLVTEMVGEFPELQGLMGGYYAAKQGLPREVSDAIRDHYKPVGQGDEVPTAPVTVAVSLADKLDTVLSFFAINEKPSGSKDPFALRRAAIGILALISTNSLRLAFSGFALRWIAFFDPLFASDLFARARQGISQTILGKPYPHDSQALFAGLTPAEFLESFCDTIFFAQFGQIENIVLEFFADRLKVQQREAGVRHDLIDAVFALGGEDDLVRLLARVKALQSFVETDEGANLLAGYKRAANILKKEEWPLSVTPAQAGIQSGEEQPGQLDSRLRGNDELSYTLEPAEAALIAALDTAEPAADAAIAAEDFEGAMAALAALRAPIDAFFEAVTVNDPDPDKRAARLSLLARIRAAVHKVADFSKIEG
ncbi:MAG: glycine--tRNA ligase subunit beta [Blastomonas sp.]